MARRSPASATSCGPETPLWRLPISPRALDVTERLYGLGVDRATHVLDPLLDGVLRPVPLDTAIARRAATLRARHYHRSTRPISLADAVLLATAEQGDRIATADPDVLAVARAERLATVRLPRQG